MGLCLPAFSRGLWPSHAPFRLPRCPHAGNAYDWAALLLASLAGMRLLELLEAHERVRTHCRLLVHAAWRVPLCLCMLARLRAP